MQRAESTAAAGRVVRREQIGIVVGVWVGIGIGIGRLRKNAAAAAAAGHSCVDSTVGVAVTRNYYWGWIGGLQQHC